MNLDTIADNQRFDHSLALDGLKVENRVLKALLHLTVPGLPLDPSPLKPGPKVSPEKEQQAAILLTRGYSIRTVAQAIGLSRSTVHKIRKQIVATL